MNHPLNNPKTKMYFSIALTMAVIFTVWIVTLVHTLKKSTVNNTKDKSISSNLKPLEDKLAVLLDDIESLKTVLSQPATTTGASLQGGLQIKPEELEKIIEKLDVSTSTPTSTPTTTKLIK